jgi:subtilase family serine protease
MIPVEESMRGTTRRWRPFAVGALALAIAAGLAGPAGAAPPASQPQPAAAATRSACSDAPAGKARCFAEFRSARQASTPRAGATPAVVQPAGYGPADLASAYKLPYRTRGAGQTVAIVDAFDNPNAEADLAVYRSTYGLPACTTANGCFRKVNQRGDAAPLPEGDVGWGVEIALDIQMVSASCPKCHILLVEGDDNSFEALAASVDTAVRLGATEVSNSYGADEFNGIDDFAASYNHPGVPITVSSGDFGFTIGSFPAVLTSVIAVGGTSLNRADNRRGWSETVWSGAGSGCSAWIDKPRWQRDRNCQMRTIADVAAVADPETGVAVYDTFGLGPDNGWIIVGGTSASAPYIAGVFALAGNGRRIDNASFLYSHRESLFDVVGGSNGFCGDDYLCTGVRGYDAPTGLGTPNGVGSF